MTRCIILAPDDALRYARKSNKNKDQIKKHQIKGEKNDKNRFKKTNDQENAKDRIQVLYRQQYEQLIQTGNRIGTKV